MRWKQYWILHRFIEIIGVAIDSSISLWIHNGSRVVELEQGSCGSRFWQG
jgi:hypothetical protein